MGSKAKKTREAKKVAQQKKAVKAKEKSEPPKSAKKAAAPEPKEMKTFSSKKRPATEMEPPAPPPPYQPETSELEKKRLQVAEELRKVEQQVSGKSRSIKFMLNCRRRRHLLLRLLIDSFRFSFVLYRFMI